MTTTPPEPLPRKKWHLARWLAVLAIAGVAYFGWKAYDYRSALKEAKALGWEVYYTDPAVPIKQNWKAIFQERTWRDAVPSVTIPKGEQFEQHRKLVHRLNPRALTVYRAHSLRDLSALDGLTRLELFLIGNAPSLTSVDALKNHPALKSITLGDCTSLTNLEGTKNLPVLESLWFEGCRGLINVDGLKNLPALKKVSLHYCTALTSVDGLKSLAALEAITLWGCTGLTNVDALKNLPAVQLISLSQCASLTKETITVLKAALPNAYIDPP